MHLLVATFVNLWYNGIHRPSQGLINGCLLDELSYMAPNMVLLDEPVRLNALKSHAKGAAFCGEKRMEAFEIYIYNKM